MRIPGLPDQRFQCPQCGGSSFGSVLLDPESPAVSRMHRYCHGDDAEDGIAGCTFNWPEEDDWRYFLVDGQKLTQEEFRRVEEEIRHLSIEGIPHQSGDS